MLGGTIHFIGFEIHGGVLRRPHQPMTNAARAVKLFEGGKAQRQRTGQQRPEDFARQIHVALRTLPVLCGGQSQGIEFGHQAGAQFGGKVKVSPLIALCNSDTTARIKPHRRQDLLHPITQARRGVACGRVNVKTRTHAALRVGKDTRIRRRSMLSPQTH